jgi:hypothetical protein
MICKNKNIVVLPSTCSAPTLALHPLEISAKYRQGELFTIQVQ